MNLKDSKYSQYALCKEMLETVDVVKNFKPELGAAYAEAAAGKKGFFLTGEGSSRLFPGKRMMYAAMKAGFDKALFTEGATQALEYELKDYAVFGASNSGKTKELVRLFKKLEAEKHDAVFGVTAFADTPVEALTKKTEVLTCGPEDAVAATKSVVEQALVLDAILHAAMGKKMEGLEDAAAKIETVLTQEIDAALIKKIADADTIYFAGRNTGVTEELTLKTNEITRKKSDYLEGTYAVHGIEEVMTDKDVVIVVDPFADEEAKFKECLADGVGCTVIAISARDTSFPTIKIPADDQYKDYLELAAGWSILVETGIALGVNPDKPVRARKVGNEFIG